MEKRKRPAGGQQNEAASHVALIPLPLTDMGMITEKLSKLGVEYLHLCLRNVQSLYETLQHVAESIVSFYNLIGPTVIF